MISDGEIDSLCPDPGQYGINVAGSTNVKILRTRSQNGFAVGTRLTGLVGRAHVQVKDSGAFNDQTGILIEDSARASVQVKRSRAWNNGQTGILVQNSNGIRLLRNSVIQNYGGSGIALDADSDGNAIFGNQITNNGVDVVDGGSGNCWHGNTFVTGAVPPCP